LSGRDIVLMSQNEDLRNWWAPPRSGIWGLRSWTHYYLQSWFKPSGDMGL